MCLTCIKLPIVTKIFVLSIFEWPFYTGFTITAKYEDSIVCYGKNNLQKTNVIIINLVSNICDHPFNGVSMKPGPKVIKHFVCSTQLSIIFIMLINVKMPTMLTS